MASKHPSEIEMANRRFAAETAYKLGYVEGAPAPIEHAREIFEFLQENEEIQTNPTGFTLD